MLSAAPGERCRRIGRHGVIVRWLTRMLSASSWMARWSGCGSTARRRRFRCWWRWAYGVMARRCCWRCATWVVKARLPGAVCLTIWSRVVCKSPSFVIIDGAAGLEKAVGLVWPEALVQRCTVHKHRNLLAHAPERLHEEISTDYNDMIYAGTAKEVEARRKSFIRKWRLKCRAVADSLEEAGDRLFTFTRLPDSQWRSARTTNAVERLHEEFKRRIKTQTVLPSAETAAMLFWALLASGQITMRKVDGWQTLAEEPTLQCIDLAA